MLKNNVKYLLDKLFPHFELKCGLFLVWLRGFLRYIAPHVWKSTVVSLKIIIFFSFFSLSRTRAPGIITGICAFFRSTFAVWIGSSEAHILGWVTKFKLNLVAVQYVWTFQFVSFLEFSVRNENHQWNVNDEK